MDYKKKNEPEKVKEKNIFKQDGREYVRKIKKCTCFNKLGDIYTFECRIKERGLRDYFYRSGDKYLMRGKPDEQAH